MPVLGPLLQRNFNPVVTSSSLSQQWSNPSDVFSVLLIIGGDVVARAIAQLAGSRVTPVAFSFGWVAYSVAALVSIVGENKLMPAADCNCKVINGETGFVRSNSSWVVGRIVRDFESWMSTPVRQRVREIVEEQQRVSKALQPPPKAGLCVSIYKARDARPGHPGYDSAFFSGFATAIVQLGLAAIPCGLYGNWAILLVTIIGIVLSFATGALPQWAEEKWACRRNTKKTVILTQGNGSQHAIVIIGDGKGLDLEDLAASGLTTFASPLTRCASVILTFLWILLLITAAGIHENTWYLLAIGAIGMLDNIYVAGITRSPEHFGIPLDFIDVIGHRKVMETLFQVESKYPRVGRSMLETFFPGKLRPNEIEQWERFDQLAEQTKAKPNATVGEQEKVKDGDVSVSTLVA